MLELQFAKDLPLGNQCCSPQFSRPPVNQDQIAKSAPSLRRVPTANKLSSIRHVELVELPGLNFPDELSAKYRLLMERVNRGLAAGQAPQLCEEGEGGTYFLSDEAGAKIAVFKPTDEEADSPNNPKRQKEQSSNTDIAARRGIHVGGGAAREVAAYLLDHDGFAGVPTTALVRFCGFRDNGDLVPAIGSLQEFVSNSAESWDVSFSRFVTEDVHRIGLLDLRLFNTDRHGGNILVKEPTARLVPIDHGLCLPPPTSAVADTWFEWLTWPQAAQAFSESEREYVASLDAEKDAAILRALGIDEAAVRTLLFGTRLVQWGARRGLTLRQLGALASRPSLGQPSRLEKLLKESVCVEEISVEALNRLVLA